MPEWGDSGLLWLAVAGQVERGGVTCRQDVD